MDREDFFYEMAFREIETGELDKATWAKAFSLSTDDEHAKKLYIQYRVEKSKNAPEAGTPDEKGAGHQNEPALILHIAGERSEQPLCFLVTVFLAKFTYCF